MSSSSTVFTPISISASALIDYYAARSGVTSAASTATSTSTVKAAGSAPTAPWSAGVTTATLTAAATRVLNGGAFINPSAAKLDVATSNTDYKTLFALYQGLTTLQSLTTAAAATTTTSSQLALIQKAFTSGLGQVRSFVATDPFNEFAVSDGSVSASDTTRSIARPIFQVTGIMSAPAIRSSPAMPPATSDGTLRACT